MQQLLQQPPHHKQRGLPGPARGRKRDQDERIHEIDHLIHMKQEKAKKGRGEMPVSAHLAADSTSVSSHRHGKKKPNAKRLEENFVDEELGHEGLRHEIQERQGILDAAHQKTTQQNRKEQRRKRMSASKQRRLSQQTGIENHTNMANINRLIGDKW